MKGSKNHEQTRFISANSHDYRAVNRNSFVSISGVEHTYFCICRYHSYFIFHLSVNQITDKEAVRQKSHSKLNSLGVIA
ncbi:hypothetical protein EHJ90_13220 [Lactiplantibacillus plantarum]|nr:hypothetical protein D7Y66_13220 [Lactiplantibacillus plantarum]RZN68506.1 hypothetical protein EHJ90_13220 [Lactiplantibacillus plantarum]